jgi:hypothetical protein
LEISDRSGALTIRDQPVVFYSALQYNNVLKYISV